MITCVSTSFSHFQKQKEDPECSWRLPDDFVVAYTEVQGEVEVGGVYLRLFIQQPSWVYNHVVQYYELLVFYFLRS